MNLPFTIDQFMEVFRTYNLAIWPTQIIAYVLGIGALLLAFRPTRFSGRIISAVLGCFWILNGAAYHLTFFSTINKAAVGFGTLFILQGLLFLWAGVIRTNLSFRFRADFSSWTGLVIILYALVVYPLLGYVFGHRFPASPVFGVAPCPTTIFTFGLFLWLERRPSFGMLLIPMIWALIGSSAVIVLGVREDIGLMASALASVLILFLRGGKEKDTSGSKPV
ncbi:MAG: DUF6064 family protein [Thermodesulfobacteriota bacterium]